MLPFHQAKQSAAVLKHGIIDAYAAPFIGKTRKWSLDRRVAFIDGYAGPGRYDDREEGSGAMLLRHARQQAPQRNVELHFVEEDSATAARLIEVVDDEGENLTVTVDQGAISEHLPGLLQECDDVPLFVYLDPCGLLIPLEEILQIFGRPGGYGAPATEVLLNFSAGALRRIAGLLTSETPVEATLARMDAVCGGDWWRQVWLDELPDKESAEAAVLDGYAGLLVKEANVGTWSIDVRRRANLKPVYYLIFASRHIDGLRYFGEASSLGLEKWRKYQAHQAAVGTLEEDGAWEQRWTNDEVVLNNQWIEAIADRLATELEKGQSFRVVDRYEEVFGDLAGVARDKHLRAAMKLVLADGLTTTTPVGVRSLLELTLRPGSG